MHAHAAGSAARSSKKRTPSVMTAISSSDTLDRFSHGKVDLWHAASLELSIGPEADNPFVQAAVHAILDGSEVKLALRENSWKRSVVRTAWSGHSFALPAAC